MKFLAKVKKPEVEKPEVKKPEVDAKSWSTGVDKTRAGLKKKDEADEAAMKEIWF